MGKAGKFAEFRPARRVFAGRGRSMLTLGEWRIALTAMLFGAAIGAGWFFDLSAAPAAHTSAEAELEPLEIPAAPKNEATVAAPAAVIAEAPSVNIALPHIVLAEPDGRDDRKIPETDYEGRLARIVDGDTFYIEGVDTRIRLWGVDAPERDEAGFDEASAMLESLAGGETLSCEHMDRDRYGRIVARCRLGDGVDLSEAMIKSGVATEYLRFTQGYYGGE